MAKQRLIRVTGKLVQGEWGDLFGSGPSGTGQSEDRRAPRTYTSIRIDAEDGPVEMRGYITTNRVADLIREGSEVTLYAVKKNGHGMIYAASNEEGRRVEDIDQLSAVSRKMVWARLLRGVGWLWWFMAGLIALWVFMSGPQQGPASEAEFYVFIYLMAIGFGIVNVVRASIWDADEMRKSLEGEDGGRGFKSAKVV